MRHNGEAIEMSRMFWVAAIVQVLNVLMNFFGLAKEDRRRRLIQVGTLIFAGLTIIAVHGADADNKELADKIDKQSEELGKWKAIALEPRLSTRTLPSANGSAAAVAFEIANEGDLPLQHVNYACSYSVVAHGATSVALPNGGGLIKSNDKTLVLTDVQIIGSGRTGTLRPEEKKTLDCNAIRLPAENLAGAEIHVVVTYDGNSSGKEYRYVATPNAKDKSIIEWRAQPLDER
jgi:hypothetical protein